MTDVLLILLFLTAFAVAWIEWIPKRYTVFLRLFYVVVVVAIGIRWLPEWYGGVVLLIAMAELTWIYFSPKRRREWPNLFSGPARVLRDGALAVKSAVKSAASSVASRRRDRKQVEQAAAPQEKTNFLTAARLRNAAGAVCAVVLSPIAAIPSALVLPVLLVAWELLMGNAPQLGDDWQEVAKHSLALSFMAIIATADLFSRHVLISAPLLLAGGYAISAYSIGSGVFWRRYSRGLLLFGTIYPIVFVAADVFDWFDGPFFN
jgi:hypothetical protein